MSNIETHTWIHIPGFTDYFVNDLGDILSRRQTKSGIVLRTFLNDKGYPQVTMYGNNGKKRTFKVHNIVALVFHGPRPEGLVARHRNGNQLDNRPGNIRYGTYSENAYDQVAHGVHSEANKTECYRGHPLSGENLMLRRDGKPVHRRCKRCHADSIARYRARKKSRS